MSMRFSLVCGRCHHQFSCTTSPEEYRQLIKTLQMDATCPRLVCRAINHVSMVDADAQVVSWSPPRTPQPVTESISQNSSAQYGATKSAVPDSQTSTSAKPPQVTPTATVPQRPEDMSPSTANGSKGKPAFEWGVADDAYGRKPTVQKYLDRFSSLPQPVQYAVLALLFGLAIVVLLYEPAAPTSRPQQEKNSVSDDTKPPSKAAEASGEEEQ